MAKIKGQNFRVFVGGMTSAYAVPEATNCSITLTGNTESTDTKDTEGYFSKESIVSKTWSVQVDSYEAEPSTLRALVTTFMAASKQTVGWDETAKTTGTQNRSPENASFKRSGQALLNDLTMTFNDRATVTVSMQYAGTGALS